MNKKGAIISLIDIFSFLIIVMIMMGMIILIKANSGGLTLGNSKATFSVTPDASLIVRYNGLVEFPGYLLSMSKSSVKNSLMGCPECRGRYSLIDYLMLKGKFPEQQKDSGKSANYNTTVISEANPNYAKWQYSLDNLPYVNVKGSTDLEPYEYSKNYEIKAFGILMQLPDYQFAQSFLVRHIGAVESAYVVHPNGIYYFPDPQSGDYIAKSAAFSGLYTPGQTQAYDPQIQIGEPKNG